MAVKHAQLDNDVCGCTTVPSAECDFAGRQQHQRGSHYFAYYEVTLTNSHFPAVDFIGHVNLLVLNLFFFKKKDHNN